MLSTPWLAAAVSFLLIVKGAIIVFDRTYALTAGINFDFSSASMPFIIKSLTTPINKSFLS
ncbi:hypothetical protein [Piscirickettsia salmonis]|uniref:hypothetical protein n=1 Tax=Piscirickettsia salmonis TaxID=1238 RepID=UPI0012B71A69|nr:hypothetical protein [Piscirickettsia salmonis]